MAIKRIALELGVGTSLRRHDYTEAAIRAVKDALWHNSISFAQAFGFPREAMIIEVALAGQQPDKIDIAAVADIFPYGQVSVTSGFGGLDIPKPNNSGHTIMVNAAIIVSFDMEKTDAGETA